MLLTLDLLSYILIVHSIMYFLCDRKYQRTRHTDAPSAYSSCSWIALVGNITHPSFARRLSLSAGSWVLRNALRVAIFRKYNCHTAFERPRTMACSQQGSTLCCLRCRCFFKLHSAIVFTHTMVIPIKKPSPSKSQLKAVAVQGKSEEMFEVR